MIMKISLTVSPREKYIGLFYLLFQLFVLPEMLVLLNGFLETPLSAGHLNLIMFGINFLVVLGIFHSFLWKNLTRIFREPWRVLKAAFVGFCVYYVSNIALSNLLLWFSPDFFNVNDQNVQTIVGENYFLSSLCVVVLVPIVEETLYRGLVFGSIYRKSPWAAYLVSTVAFAAIHVIGYIGSYSPVQLLLCFLQYLPAGLCLGWAYAKSDCLWASVLMHMTINQIGLSLMR